MRCMAPHLEQHGVCRFWKGFAAQRDVSYSLWGRGGRNAKWKHLQVKFSLLPMNRAKVQEDDACLANGNKHRI